MTDSVLSTGIIITCLSVISWFFIKREIRQFGDSVKAMSKKIDRIGDRFSFWQIQQKDVEIKMSDTYVKRSDLSSLIDGHDRTHV